MIRRCLVPTLVLTSLIVGPIGCGDSTGDDETSSESSGDGDTDASASADADAGDGDSSSASGDGDSGDGDSGDGDSGDGDSGDGDSGDGDSGDGDSGDGDTTTGDGDGDCMAWRVVYNLDGSEFQITDTPLGAGDTDVPLETPYDEDDTIGPGEITVMFTDDGGSPGDGTAHLVDYEVVMNFVTGSSGTALVTQTLVISTSDECGSARGSLSGSDVSWSPDTLADLNSLGNINCQGSFCGSFGAPESGDNPVDETGDITPFSSFAFSADLSTFSADGFVTSSDNTATTTMVLEGTEVSRELVAAPGCFCG